MSIVRPFRGLRVRPDLAGRVAAPPYDVVSTAEAKAFADGNPTSFFRVSRAEIELPPGVDPHSPAVYEHAKKNLDRFTADGIFVREALPSFYLYRLTMDSRPQTGLVALTSVAEYDAGRIRKHEHTRPDKVEDRGQHILTLDAQVEPVFSMFRARPAIRAAFARHLSSPAKTDFVADGVRHELWTVSEASAVQEIVDAFAPLELLYIADGHHRSEAASLVAARTSSPGDRSPRAFFLNVLFPDDEVRILPYNRAVVDLRGQTLARVLERASEAFEVNEETLPITPGEARTFGVYAEGRWFRLRARPGIVDLSHPTRSLDVSILAEFFLAPILGIENPRTDKRIDFIGGIRGIEALRQAVDTGSHAIAFSLHATTIAELLRVADAGEVMPPKSTWFEPKLRSGLVMSPLAD